MLSEDTSPAIDRILEVLKASPLLSDVRQFRFGSLPKPEMHSVTPTVYVTPADRAEVYREAFGPSMSQGAAPPQKIVYEFWVRALVEGPTPENVQRLIASVIGRAARALALNVQLRRPSDGNDPMCATSRVHVQGSLVAWRGRLLEGQTLRLRMHSVLGYAAPAPPAPPPQG